MEKNIWISEQQSNTLFNESLLTKLHYSYSAVVSKRKQSTQQRKITTSYKM